MTGTIVAGMPRLHTPPRRHATAILTKHTTPTQLPMQARTMMPTPLMNPLDDG